MNNAFVVVLVAENYYFRNNSYASLSITLFGNDEAIDAIVVSSGAGGGVLNVSWGAASEFLRDAETFLLSYGFEAIK